MDRLRCGKPLLYFVHHVIANYLATSWYALLGPWTHRERLRVISVMGQYSAQPEQHSDIACDE